MNATLDSPFIEMPLDPAVSTPPKGVPQGPRAAQPPHLASRVTDCKSLSLRHASADDKAQIQRLVHALLSGDNARLCLLAFCAIRDEDQSRMVALRTAECLATQHGFRVCVIDPETSTSENSGDHWSVEVIRSSQTHLSWSQSNMGELWLLNASETAVMVTSQPNSTSVKEQLLALHRSFDYTILCAPATQRSASVPIWNGVEGIVLVLKAGRVRRQAFESATRGLAAGNARLLGTVLTGRVLPIPERLFRWLRL